MTSAQFSNGLGLEIVPNLITDDSSSHQLGASGHAFHNTGNSLLHFPLPSSSDLKWYEFLL